MSQTEFLRFLLFHLWFGGRFISTSDKFGTNFGWFIACMFYNLAHLYVVTDLKEMKEISNFGF